MNPIDVLQREHQLIERMLSVLDALTSRAEAGEPVERADLERCVKFFREFVDLGHHEKEESILFPVLTDLGFDWSSGPLARIRKEHDQERYLMRSLRHAALQKSEWSVDGRRHFVSVAREFLELQRTHLMHENLDLFPLARTKLPEDRGAKVVASFENLDGERENFDELVASVGELYTRYRH
ncbi:MAG: hemerythrin domain-containing protein [Myxococcales bacterium]|nr:hemerythrin domain-containing protein [Myxococcales bacterium]MCB9580639.1 hemerythrin domain-containing protein [Polyangiaceae bacterium]